MIFEKIFLEGAYLIKPEPHYDERGFFARSFCKQEFQTHGLVDDYVQCNISYNKKKGTLRGMHYQLSPHQETKLVRCSRGAIYDVIIDLRTESPTYKQWFAVELTQDNAYVLYIPEGFAHGFYTLQNDSDVFYQISTSYEPEYVAGLNWKDPGINIDWPDTQQVIVSDRDNELPFILAG